MCLFTSYGYSRADPAKGKPGRDTPGKILERARTSLAAFREQLGSEKGSGEGGMAVYSPMFNSGAFKVPWDKTAALIEECLEGWDGRWTVLTPPS